MKITQTKIAFATLTVLSVISVMGCSTTHKVDTSQASANPDSAIIDSNVAVENGATYYTELGFHKSSAKLTAEDRASLKDLIEKSLNKGDVNEIKVISWADQEYPQGKAKKLSKRQRMIADQRNDEIKKYLKRSYPTLDISVYNMASRPTVLQDLFKTADSRTKKSFEDAGVASMDEVNATQPDKASKSLVLSIVGSN